MMFRSLNRTACLVCFSVCVLAGTRVKGDPQAIEWSALPLPAGGTASYNPKGERQAMAIQFDAAGRIYVAHRYNGRGKEVVLRSADDGKTWEAVGPEQDWTLKLGPNDGGFRIHPLKPDWWYLGSENRGVYATFDAGKTWQHVIDGWTKTGIGHGFTFAFHPTNPNRVYASGGIGVFRTDDGGKSWANLKLPNSQTQWVAVDPKEPDHIYAAQMWKSGGVLRSTDGGDTWHAIEDGIPDGRVTPSGYFNNSAWQIHIHPIDPRTLYVTTASGVFVSADRGDHWKRLTPAPRPGVMCTRVIFRQSPANPDVIATSEAVGRVSLTRDGGKTWHDITGNLRTGAMPHRAFGIRVGELQFHPTQPDTLYVARTDGVYRVTLQK